MKFWASSIWGLCSYVLWLRRYAPIKTAEPPAARCGPFAVHPLLAVLLLGLCAAAPQNRGVAAVMIDICELLNGFSRDAGRSKRHGTLVGPVFHRDEGRLDFFISRSSPAAQRSVIRRTGRPGDKTGSYHCSAAIQDVK